MCESCYAMFTDGVDPEITQEMRDTAALVARIYEQPWGGSGGPLHVIVDDMNVDDRAFTDERAAQERDWIERGYEEMCARADPNLPIPVPSPAEEGYDDRAKGLCLRVYSALAGMTEPERAWCVRWDTQWNKRFEVEGLADA